MMGLFVFVKYDLELFTEKIAGLLDTMSQLMKEQGINAVFP